MQVRAKMKLTQKTEYASLTPYCDLTFEAQHSQTPEDNSYAQATPTASINMTVTNPAVLDTLKLGTTFYVDFTPIADEQ